MTKETHIENFSSHAGTEEVVINSEPNLSSTEPVIKPPIELSIETVFNYKETVQVSKNVGNTSFTIEDH